MTLTNMTSTARMQKRASALTPWLTLVIILALTGCLTTSVSAADGATGKITGKVVDKETGEALIGVTLMLKGTQIGARTDLDGNFTIKKIPPSVYDIVISCVGYTRTEVVSVVVSDGETTALNVAIQPQAIELQGIKVSATAVQNTEATMLKKRSKALTISNAISAEDISRSGSGDAAQAMSKITGASVIGGKFVYIRGLGDRYSNTNLNGSPLPSPDLEKQGVPLDMIPAGLLDNIVIEKTFSPDKPGNFAGGSANLVTKDYPSERTLNLSIGTSYNTVATGNSNYLTHDRSSTDWLGYDNGHRDIPDYVNANSDLQRQSGDVPGFLDIVETDTARIELAHYMDTSSRSFKPEMIPSVRTAPPYQSYSLSYGDQLSVLERPLGVVASLNYGHKYRMYENGFEGRYKAAGTHPKRLTASHELNEAKSTEEVLWGGLMAINYSLAEHHKLSASLIYTRNGESESRLLEGVSPEYSDPNEIYRARTLSYKERKLHSLQFGGSHVGLPWLGTDIRTSWQASISHTNQNVPDWRSSSDEMIPHLVEDDETGDLVWDGTYDYVINYSRYGKPIRVYRNTDESNNEYKLDFTIPLGRLTRFKTGTAFLTKERSHRERKFIYLITDRYSSYGGDLDAFFSDVGIRHIREYEYNDTLHYQFAYSNFLREDVELRNQYDGTQDVLAFYGMVELPIFSKLAFVGGVRYETTDMVSESHDDTYDAGAIDERQWLPSVNFIYKATADVNIRASYGRTLARPTLREMSPHYSETFGLGRKTSGNANLEQTLIDNLDLRWEWFIRPGEVAAVSGFYKSLKEPIEMGFHGNNGAIQSQNADRATLYGVEFELRSHLDRIWSRLVNFSFGGNLTLVHSEVAIPDEEMALHRWYDPDADDTRPLWGQSPYIVNADIAYENFEGGTSVSLFYNVFGPRMAFNADFPTGDVYEQPRNQLDLLVSQQLFGGPKFKFSVKNILGEDAKFVHERLGTPEDDADGEHIYKQCELGMTYSVGVSYQLW